ncbi:MAG: CAP domain-containing protein [Armatimonadetes bacterium]|nr:CAP domain-containing protein [Armatimonadota bacterium]
MHGQRFRWLLLVVGLALPAARAADGCAVLPWWEPGTFEGVADVEARLFESTNAERRKRNLPVLKPLPALQTAARQHSQEMLKEDYFEHDSPHAQWRTASMRAYRSGLWEGKAGENIVYMKTTGYTMSHELLAREFMYGDHGWMNSPPHKANILDPDYTHLGLGVAAKNGRYYATQVFAKPYYELTELWIRDGGRYFELTGTVQLLNSTRRVHLAIDREMVDTINVPPDGQFELQVRIPKDGERHKVGLHPAKDRNSFWIEFLFFLDTSKRYDQTMVMPFD